jgi:hypothetical protein
MRIERNGNKRKYRG